MTKAYVAVLGVAVATTLLLTPLVRWVAVEAGRARAARRAPGPRAARPRPSAASPCGSACSSALAVGVAARHLRPRLRHADGPARHRRRRHRRHVHVGWLDELRKVHGNGVSAPAKIAGLVLAGSILSLAGVSTVFFRVPFFGIFSLSPDLSAFVTVCWVVGMANAINLIDGLDGLAAGIIAIAAGAFLLYGAAPRRRRACSRPATSARCVAVIVLGICLGFLPWNVHPARIFMGDCGALLLGVLMAASTMSVGGSTDAVYSRPVVLLLRPAVHPARHPRRADPRHRCSPSCAGRRGAPAWPPPTRSTSTTGCCGSATATGGPCSSCGRGRRCCRASCCSRRSPNRGDALVPAGHRRPRPWPLHGASTPAPGRRARRGAPSRRPSRRAPASRLTRVAPAAGARASETMDLRLRNPVF